MSNPVAVLNGDQIYLDELIRENARLTVEVEAERQQGRLLSANLSRMRDERDRLAQQAEQAVDAAEEYLSLAVAGVEREKVLASKLDQVIKDLHFVMAGGNACTVCKNKCLMGTADACEPRWKGLDD